jgi:hypothetical protein
MNKLDFAVLAFVFAVLGGCASNPADFVGTGYSETNNPSQPYPIGSLILSDD